MNQRTMDNEQKTQEQNIFLFFASCFLLFVARTEFWL